MIASDSRERFSGRVEAYARARPGYPAGLIALLRRESALAPSAAVADVGSGTGILSLPFLRFGNTIFAVEPNARMRAAAEELLGAEP
jgi:predicted RNA methylase